MLPVHRRRERECEDRYVGRVKLYSYAPGSLAPIVSCAAYEPV